jgi:hypothetical protein
MSHSGASLPRRPAIAQPPPRPPPWPPSGALAAHAPCRQAPPVHGVPSGASLVAVHAAGSFGCAHTPTSTQRRCTSANARHSLDSAAQETSPQRASSPERGAWLQRPD